MEALVKASLVWGLAAKYFKSATGLLIKQMIPNSLTKRPERNVGNNI